MQEIDGKWTIFGCESDNPKCLHTVEEAIAYINEVGFLPFFSNDIPGFSLEERTVSEDWWCDDKAKDPWIWREIIAESGNIAYGKFFYNRAGFITKDWLPFFANYRRDGYDFDALWDDEKAPLRSKKIMDMFAEENSDAEIFSNELKQKSGFGKDGEKGFEGVITSLQMQTYLCIREFKQRKNKKGESYGWPIAVYCTLEHLFGRDIVSRAYTEPATESGKRIVKHVMELYPEATPQQIKRLLGGVVGESTEKIKKEKKVEYPGNLLKALELDILHPNDDQLIGLEYALGTLKSEARSLIEYRFEKGETYTDIGKIFGFSGATASKRCKKAVKHLKKPELSVWIKEGYNGHSDQNIESISVLKERFIKEGNEFLQ